MKKAAPRRERHKVRMKQVYPRYWSVMRKVASLESLVHVVGSRKQELGVTEHDVARAQNSGRRRTPERRETLTRIQRRASEHGLKPLPAKFQRIKLRGISRSGVPSAYSQYAPSTCGMSGPQCGIPLRMGRLVGAEDFSAEVGNGVAAVEPPQSNEQIVDRPRDFSRSTRHGSTWTKAAAIRNRRARVN